MPEDFVPCSQIRTIEERNELAALMYDNKDDATTQQGSSGKPGCHSMA
jgi:hypothetical protein